jgi:FMN reductase
MTNLLAIVGSVSKESKTREAIEIALDAAADSYDVDTDILHLAEYEIDTADGRQLEEYTGDTAEALDLIVESTAYIIGTPVYRASYSGALKNLFDMVPRGMWQADVAPLANSAVGLIATGATNHHYLSIDEQLRPVMAFFGAQTVGSGVYANAEHFADGQITDDEIRKRLKTVGRATVELSQAIEKSPNLAQLEPQM